MVLGIENIFRMFLNNIFQLRKKNVGVENNIIGIYFDSEFLALSIGDVFRAIRALLRVERASAPVFSDAYENTI